MLKYQSWGGSMTITEAIKHLGADHVFHIINKPDYHKEIKRRIAGSWVSNDSKNHTAYCVIMQSGAGIVSQHI